MTNTQRCWNSVVMFGATSADGRGFKSGLINAYGSINAWVPKFVNFTIIGFSAFSEVKVSYCHGSIMRKKFWYVVCLKRFLVGRDHICIKYEEARKDYEYVKCLFHKIARLWVLKKKFELNFWRLRSHFWCWVLNNNGRLAPTTRQRSPDQKTFSFHC